MEKKEIKTQTSEVLKYLENHKKGITSLDAIRLFGATRLSGIIFILRKRGYNIETTYKQVPNRFGGLSTVAVYTLN